MREVSTNVSKRNRLMKMGAMLIVMTLMLTFVFAFAAPEVPQTLTGLLDDMIFYVGLIFQVVGVLLAIYAVGQMIMAFKDENPDAKTKAATLLVVAIILITLPQIISSLNLASKITGK